MRHVLYAKLTKERKKQFQIRTRIIEEDGVRYAEKMALYNEGKNHVLRMVDYVSRYQLENIQPVNCKIENDSIVFPFVEGKTMSSVLCETIQGGDRIAALQLLFRYRDLIYKLGEGCREFEISDGFIEIFGDYGDQIIGKAGRYINIDNILENIIKTKDDYKIIDYEWFFDFLIPYDFVIWRACLDLFVNYADVMNQMFCYEELLHELDIEPDQYKIYEQMNVKFNEYVFGSDDSYNTALQKYRLNKWNPIEDIYQNTKYAQLYYDCGDGYSEKNSLQEAISKIDYMTGGRISIEWKLPVCDKKINELRFDPFDQACVIENFQIELFNKNNEKIKFDYLDHNGVGASGKEIAFYNNDPQIVIGQFDGEPCVIKVAMEIYSLTDEKMLGMYLDASNRYIERLKSNNQQLAKYINELASNKEER